MLGSLARRERRPLWGVLAFVLFVASAIAMLMGAQARASATEAAARDAEFVAQTELAPLLVPRDLEAPVVGLRAIELTNAIDAAITSVGPVERVRVYSSIGRILYADDPTIVGTRPSYLRDLTFEVANGGTRVQVHSGLLQTYAPLWITPEGTVVVAEMSQVHGPIAAAATGPWNLIALACGALMLGAIAMVVKTSLARPSTMPVQVYQHQAPAKRLPKEQRIPAFDAPIYQHPGFRAIEEQRLAAEARAKADEENYRAVQRQLKDSLEKIKSLEGRLALEESQTTTNDTELQALRDQLKDTAERLHKTELDNNQLRERMALRQRELENARHQLASIRTGGGDLDELTERLQEAEQHAAQVAREMERLENELDYTKSKFHMTKLSEALREFDNEGLEIDIDRDDDDLFEHPVIIRGTGESLTTPGKVR